MRRDGKPDSDADAPGSGLALNLTFEEAVRRAMQVKKPEGGIPDFKTRQRRGKDNKER